MSQAGMALARPISADDVATYRRDGYFLYHAPVFAPARLARLTALFEEHAAALKEGRRTDELDTPHFSDPRLLEFLLADEVLDLVQPFIGANIGLWSSHFISKEPRVGRATPWHEDSSYWNGRADTMEGIITVWLALDKATEENGCMRVIPGSHLAGGFSEYERVDRATNLFGSQIKPEQIDETKAVAFELGARRVLPARGPPDAQRATEHERHAALRLHNALLQHGDALLPREKRGAQALAGPRERPGQQSLRALITTRWTNVYWRRRLFMQQAVERFALLGRFVPVCDVLFRDLDHPHGQSTSAPARLVGYVGRRERTRRQSTSG